jgi:hypothetical protein
MAPAQVLTSFAADGSRIEEIKYFLPSGIAVHFQHLLDAVTTAKGEFNLM